MSAEASVRTQKVSILSQQHPEYVRRVQVWNRLRVLYAGGDDLKAEAHNFLVQRPKEQAEIYAFRSGPMFTYANHIGTALDWYAGKLMEEKPTISPCIDVRLKDSQKEFYDAFAENCTRGGTAFLELSREVFQHVLLYRTAYVLVDLPGAHSGEFKTRFEQEQAGALNPYLVPYTPLSVTNWEEDDFGNLTWAVISTSAIRSAGPYEQPQAVDRWYVYTRERFDIWERVRKLNEAIAPAEAFATWVNGGDHAMTQIRQVPLLRVSVKEGLWLGNRAYLIALQHLNTDNALHFALFMSAMAMPVIMTDEEVQMTLSETGFLKLPFDSKYQWTEPAGHSFMHLSDKLQELTENIYRAFYLVAQGRSGRATPTAQSMVSKQIDMQPAKDVMKLFGDMMRSFMKKAMQAVSIARGDDNLKWDVQGFNFAPELSADEAQADLGLMNVGIPSETFEREVGKKITKSRLPNISKDTYDKICSEIDKAPSKADRELQALTDRAKVIAAAAPKAPGTSPTPKAPAKDTGKTGK